MNIKVLEAIFDELEKVGASARSAGYMQSRQGVRPIRVHNLVDKTNRTLTSDPELEPPAPMSSNDDEDQEIGKTAAKPVGEKVMEGFAEARPYVVGAAKGAVPAAVLGGIFGKRRATKIIPSVIGAGLGAADVGIKDWAERHKRKAVAKKILGSG
jgi:hypothetical protein